MHWLKALGNLFAVTAALAAAAAVADSPHKPLRAGMIGLDTSHAPAFAKILTDPKAEGVLAEVRLVAAYPQCSPDLPTSRDRVAGYTEDLKKMWGVDRGFDRRVCSNRWTWCWWKA